MASQRKLEGVVVPTVTFFKEDKSICEQRMRAFTDYLIDDCGVHGLFVPGSTGDYTLLSMEERKALIQLAVKIVRGRVPLYAGTGHNATHIALELTEFAERVGADAALVSLPHYPRPTQEGLFAHYEAIAQQVHIPLLVYNYPGGMGLDVDPPIVARLAEAGAISGIKDSVDDLDHTSEIIRAVGARISVFTGMDGKFFPTLVMGGVGLIGTAANVAPKHFVAIWRAYRDGDYRKARDLQLQVLELCRLVAHEQGATKAALELMGFPAGAHRMPVTSVLPATRARFKETLDRLGLLDSIRGLA